MPAAGTINADEFVGPDRDLTPLITSLDLSQPRRLRLGIGVYHLVAGTEIGNLHLEGQGSRTVISKRGGKGPYLLKSTGKAVRLPTLAKDITSGDAMVEFTNRPACDVGDLLFFTDPKAGGFSLARPLYREGFSCLVERIQGKRVWLSSRAVASLERRRVHIARIDPTEPSIENLAIASGTSGALHTKYSRGVYLKNVSVEAAAPIGIYLDRNFDFRVINTTIENRGSGSGSDYGLAIGNSQNGHVTDGKFFGRRHGISVGGSDFPDSMPNRDIAIQKAAIVNDKKSLVHAADLHGNCEGIRYRDCDISGGASLSGRDNGYYSCRISALASGVCVVGTEVLGGKMTVQECALTTAVDPSKTYRGIIDFGGNSIAIGPHTTVPCRIEVVGSEVIATNQSRKGRVLEVRNRGASVPIDVLVHSCIVKSNGLGSFLSLRNHGRREWSGKVSVDEVISNLPLAEVSGHFR